MMIFRHLMLPVFNNEWEVDNLILVGWFPKEKLDLIHWNPQNGQLRCYVWKRSRECVLLDKFR